jgi:hypothetical protein
MMRVKVTITGFMDVEPEDYANEAGGDDEDVDIPDDADIFAAIEEEFDEDVVTLNELEEKSFSFERVEA